MSGFDGRRALDRVAGQGHVNLLRGRIDPINRHEGYENGFAADPVVGVHDQIPTCPDSLIDEEIVHVANLAIGRHDVIAKERSHFVKHCNLQHSVRVSSLPAADREFVERDHGIGFLPQADRTGVFNLTHPVARREAALRASDDLSIGRMICGFDAVEVPRHFGKKPVRIIRVLSRFTTPFRMPVKMVLRRQVRILLNPERRPVCNRAQMRSAGARILPEGWPW